MSDSKSCQTIDTVQVNLANGGKYGLSDRKNIYGNYSVFSNDNTWKLIRIHMPQRSNDDYTLVTVPLDKL